jgi:hypothetical protein
MFLLACLSVATVQAKVYQCTDENGSVTFSDRPCANDAKLATGLEDGNSGIAPGGDLSRLLLRVPALKSPLVKGDLEGAHASQRIALF